MLIGCGRWGLIILRDLLTLGCQVDVVDCDESRLNIAIEAGARSAAKTIGIESKVSGVVIATPATCHFESIQMAQQLGVPLFVEKPLTVDSSHANQLLKDCTVPLFVMHTWRYHAGINCLAEIVSSGELGAIETIYSMRQNWTSPRQDVDPIWTLLPHDISILLEIMGRMPTPLSAKAEFHRGKPVGATCFLEAGNTQIVINVSTRFKEKRREFRLHGENGIAVMPDDVQGVVELTHTIGGAEQTETLYWPTTPSAMQQQLDIFVHYLNGGPPPKCDLKTGIAIVDVVSRLRRMAGID